MHWTASCQVVQAFTFYHLGARKGGGVGSIRGLFLHGGEDFLLLLFLSIIL